MTLILHRLRASTRPGAIHGAALGRVRLLGIDAPELTQQPQAKECYAQAATARLERLLPSGTIVDLVADPQQPARDSYGRLLRYVYGAGDDVSTALLAAGVARLHDAAPEVARDRQLRAAAARARSNRLGLWGACPDARDRTQSQL